jgi:hypothetical protein
MENDARKIVAQNFSVSSSSSTKSHVMDDNAGRILWEEIESAIDERMVSSEFEKTPSDFLPEGELDQILKEFSKRKQYGGDLRHVISVLLLLHPPSITKQEQALVDYILDDECPALKLFFTVLYAKHDRPYEAMTLLMRKPMRDADLPIQWSNEKLRRDLHNHPFALLEGGSNELWPRHAIKSFQERQWLFQAPVLTTDPAKIPGQFGQSTLPFVQRDARRSGGAFGIVYKYTIQPNHLDMKEKVLDPGTNS